ncbi:MAG: methyltransferase domain-containing protein [Alphaproteobacteria bacterium]|nr:methyltransferase domain-containing protein [Alphaproteobacteria bacterium]
MPLLALQVLEKKVERRIRLFEQRNGVRILDEVAFIRSWIEKPLSMGAVTPSGKALARMMASYVDPEAPGPVIELGSGTGAVTRALVERGIEPSRLVLVEFNPTFCRMLRTRYPEATVIQGDAYRIQHLLGGLLREPASAVVSGLPLQTKPFKRRLGLVSEAFELMAPSAPFIQFTYAMVTPVPMRAAGITGEASKLVWTNVPPARVWVYRKS